MIAVYTSDTIVSTKEIEIAKIIRGTVIDHASKVPITGASIHIWNTVSRTRVESNGKFSIEVPKYLNEDVLMMEIKFTKYESKIISFKQNEISDFITIKLEQKERQYKSEKRKSWSFFR